MDCGLFVWVTGGLGLSLLITLVSCVGWADGCWLVDFLGCFDVMLASSFGFLVCWGFGFATCWFCVLGCIGYCGVL